MAKTGLILMHLLLIVTFFFLVLLSKIPVYLGSSFESLFSFPVAVVSKSPM
jgi:hypothetical protein